MRLVWQEGVWMCGIWRQIWVLQWWRRLLFLEPGSCPHEHYAQSFTGLLFPPKADNTTWAQLFNLDCLRKSWKEQRKSTEAESSFISISNENWDQEHLSPAGDGCFTWKKGLWFPVYVLLHIRLYAKLLKCVPIFARKDRTIFIWWLYCTLLLSRGTLLSLAKKVLFFL